MSRKAPEPSTVKKLFAYSGNQCAKPGCNKPMISEDGSTVHGEICHIAAANSNGPRYDSYMTDDERRSFDNLILLCGSHHKEIDNKSNLEKYPSSTLLTWKKKHEKSNAKSLSEVSDEIVKSALWEFMRPVRNMMIGLLLLAFISVGITTYIFLRGQSKEEGAEIHVTDVEGEPAKNEPVLIEILEGDSIRQKITLTTDSLGIVERPKDAKKLKVTTNPGLPNEQTTVFEEEDLPREGLIQVFKKKGAIPLNIKFLTLGSHAVDYFLEEKYIGDLKHPFNNATIVKNDVYKWMNELRNKFNYYPLESYALYRSPLDKNDHESVFVMDAVDVREVKTFIFKPNTKSRWFRNSIPLNNHQLIKEILAIPGWYIDGKYTDKAGYFGKKHTYRYVDSDFVEELNKIFREIVPKSGEGMDLFEEDPDEILNWSFDNIQNLFEVNQFLGGDTNKKLLQFEIALGFDVSCGDEFHRISIHTPETKLKVLFIKNEEDENITINSVFFKKYGFEGLFDLKDTINVEPKSNGNSLLSDFVLPPGDKLILPLYLYFDWERKNHFNLFIQDTLQRPIVSKFLWDVDSLTIGGINYSIREENEIKLSFYDDIDEGSCPYVFTQDGNGNWIIENHILFGFNAREKEKLDTLRLQRFNGKLLIKENDPETSYLDFVSILCRSEAMEDFLILPKRKKLNSINKDYIEMNQGDSILLDFEGFRKMPEDTQFFLISKGYYIPYNSNAFK